MRILIAEDNPLMRRCLKRLVSDLAPSVFECSDGKSAIDLYRELRPDVVLMDVRMPEMDGLTALDEIVRDCPSAIVLIVTEHDETAYRREALKCGATAYFLKENLQDVREWLQKMADVEEGRV
jgi:DNA-binding NarL/FixJ family response regulator